MTGCAFDDIPDQTGRTGVVTGADTGISFETAGMLPPNGARIVLAPRGRDKAVAVFAQNPAEKLQAATGGEALDLAYFDLGAAFADRSAKARDRLDLPVNIAGVNLHAQTRAVISA